MQVGEKAYSEIVDLFARGSSAEEILQFRPSEAAQRRATYLLERGRAGELTGEEEAELEQLGQVEHFMQLIKARVRLNSQSQS